MSKTNGDMNIAHNLDEWTNRKTSDIAIDESVDFSGMLLSEPILRGLKKAGFKRPSPIQLKAIPPARCGIDLIVQAKSGTGKTCVFVVIALETVVLENLGTQVLILAPTREIARQSYESCLAIGCCLPGLKCACFIGGTTLKNDKVTSKQCHIVVGSPGRVCQLIQEGDLSIDAVRLFVLDEADKLMDESYQENINWIFSRLPANKQLMVLSATFPSQLDQFLTKYMKTPQMVKLDSNDVQLVGIKQYVFTVTSSPGEDWLLKKIEGLHLLLSKATFSQCLIFCNFQDKAEKLCSVLKKLDWPVEFIAAQLSQPQRLNVMKRLKKFQCRVLVSTDLTARGIDAEHVNLVINFDVPFNAETYLHRIGRAGRFGGYGAAITILCGWQTELSFYQMAGENKFRAKKLPNDFPLDVVCNESFFDNLPLLEIPDLTSYERKAAFKNAKKNIPLQSEDFYGNFMKNYSYKCHRNDPQTYRFTPPVIEDSDENVVRKYDREVFERVLKEILGVKVRAPKKAKEVVASEFVKIRPSPEKLSPLEPANRVVNGHIEQEGNVVTPSIESDEPRPVESKNVVNGRVSGLDDREIREERVINGGLVDIEEGTTDDFLVHNEKAESDEQLVFVNETRADDDDVRVDENVDANGNENVSTLLIDKQFVISIPTNKEDHVEPKISENRPQMSYSDTFNALIDNHLCSLYGGFSWHQERAKILRQNKPVPVNDQDDHSSNRCDKKKRRHRQSRCNDHSAPSTDLNVLSTNRDDESTDLGDQINGNGDDQSSNCSKCWNEYNKVLEQYKAYMACHSSQNCESFTKYADAWRKYERTVSRMATCLFESQNVMNDYCGRMMSE